MLLLLITAIIGATDASANSSRSVCAQLVAETQTELKIAQDRFQIGEVDYVEVARANLNLLEVQFNCRAITFDGYCEMALPLAKRRLQGVIENEKVGMGSISDIQSAKKELAIIEGLCN